MSKTELINKIYTVFPSESFNTIDHCPCGCCNHIKIKKLLNEDRSKIDFYTIGTYADKALTTIGEVKHYQHFVPRICEMILEGVTRCGIDMCFLSKLEDAHFKTWGNEKIEIIIQFLQFYNNTKVSDIEDDSDLVNDFINKYKL